MLLTSSDNFLIRQVTLFYCVSSCILLPLSIIALYTTDAYLQAGKSTSLPMFSILAAFEVVKWCFHQLIYNKDFISKNKGLPFVDILWRRISVSECIKGAFVVCVGVAAFFVIAILYGAQIMDDHEATSMFSIFMSLLTVFPMCLHLGRSSIIKFFNKQAPNNTFHWLVHRNVQFAILGAWLGAFVIPLDWNRPWQVWPVPSSFGALIGYTFSHYVILFQYFILPKSKKDL